MHATRENTVQLNEIVTEVTNDCAAEYRQRMRARLLRQSREWLVEQLLDYVADFPASEHEHATTDAAIDEDRVARTRRIRAMNVDEACVRAFMHRYRNLDRDRLEADGYLIAPPTPGGPLVGPRHRTKKGSALLRDAEDMLDAMLFGDEDTDVRLCRVERELLTITVPCDKAGRLACLLRAATQITAEGTWRDPEHVANDERRANTLFQVEYGEVAGETIGHGVALALRLINDLEINEQVLYARVENVEESTLA